MSTLKVNTITSVDGGTPSIPGFSGGGGDGSGSGADAWGVADGSGNFVNGLNVASVTRNSIGNYSVVFTTPMPDANYAITTGNLQANSIVEIVSQTATGFNYLRKAPSNGVLTDLKTAFAVFATNALPPTGGTGTDAWGTVELTSSNGLCSVPGSFNVASVTRTGEGRYDVVFTTPMPNANYSIQTSPVGVDSTQAGRTILSRDITANGFSVTIRQSHVSSVVSDNAFSFAVNATNAVLPDSFSEEQIQSVVDLAQSGVTNPGASAWSQVEGDGTLIGGLNFSSVTRTQAGFYTYVFQTPMPDANYSVVVQHSGAGNTSINGLIRVRERTATGFSVVSANTTASAGVDSPHATAVFATNAVPPTGGTGTDAWAYVNSSGISNATFNCSTVKQSTGIYVITFDTPVPTTNYAAMATSMSTGANAYTFIDQSAGNGTQLFYVYTTNSSTGSLADAPFSVTVNATNAVLPDSFSEEQIQSVVDLAQSGVTNPGASAWGDVEEDGTFVGGLNVASVVRSSQGQYVVNFTTPMPNANYSAQVTVLAPNDRNGIVISKSANSFQVTTRNASGTASDTPFSFTVFATNALPPKGGTGADAWVNVGTDGSPSGSFNATSSFISQGTYQITFNTALPNTNYAIATSSSAYSVLIQNKSVTGFQALTLDAVNALQNYGVGCIVHATNATLPQTVTTEQIDAAINNPGASAWGKVTSAYVLENSLNCTINRNGIAAGGQYNVVFNTPMPSADYSIVCSAGQDSLGNLCVASYRNVTALGFQLVLTSRTSSASSNLANVESSFTVFATNALPPKGGTGADAWVTSSGEGFNIASVTQSSGNGNNFVVVFTTPMPSDDYSVVATPITASDGTCFIRDRTATGFTVVTRDYDGSVKALGWGAVVHATNATLPTTFTESQIQSVIDAQPQGIAKAWVNFDGTGTVAIRDSLNINSITDNGVGDYRINFTAPMSNSNYSAVVSTNHQASNTRPIGLCDDYTATGFRVTIEDVTSFGASRGESSIITAVVFSS
jgi:hypothetical protein